MSIVKNIRSLNGAGVLADRAPAAESLEFRKYNLIYGFNGTGKSTLSRLFSSVQRGAQEPRLPPGCKFEIELDDNSILQGPDHLTGLQRRVVVFNTDFVEDNLKWATGNAAPIFYIGKEQAALAAALAEMERKIPTAEQQLIAAEARVKSADKTLGVFKRERAKQVADRLNWKGRKYEANHLADDFAKLAFDESALLDSEALDAATATCRQDEAMARVEELPVPQHILLRLIEDVKGIAAAPLATAVLEDLKAHPEMLIWVREGHAYHTSHALKECLYCGNPISDERKDGLAKALDNRLSALLKRIDATLATIEALRQSISSLSTRLPAPDRINAELKPKYNGVIAGLVEPIQGLLTALQVATDILEEKRRKPSLSIEPLGLPSEIVCLEMGQSLREAIDRVNGIMQGHNHLVDRFGEHQEKAREDIRKHFLAASKDEYEGHEKESRDAEAAHAAGVAGLEALKRSIDERRAQIRQHGPAADVMNKLITIYLGHSELTIAAIEEGYKIQRHRRQLEGPPSEGEKTAIALCYFVSTLESDGRALKDLIVLVDDPVSSLDTKALNFACAMVRNRLADAAQLFVLTHNQHCLNEFRKAWKNLADPPDGKDPKATFMFLDMKAAPGGRKSALGKLSKLLREYDSEYFFLVKFVLEFVASQGEYEYEYMMPNVLRRVLDVFLAFRCPGSSGLAGKIKQVCAKHKDLDLDKLTALERLVQVESHSDNIDDLIAFSSMTLEESRDAAAALMLLMQTIDPEHVEGLKRVCR